MNSIFQDAKFLDPPKEDEIEITLFGPGYGESAVLKLPKVGWFVVDSCKFSAKGLTTIPPLEYLKAQAVKALVAVVLTHPHEDHYLGLVEILAEYKGRIDYICRYAAEGIREFKEYLASHDIAGIVNARKFSELFQAFKEAANNGAWRRDLGELTPIIDDQVNGVSVTALTPSSDSVRQYTELLYNAIGKVGQYVHKFPDHSHNLIASAIWISVGSVRIILGSDVKNGISKTTGWRGVLSNPDKPNLSVQTVKVSHHGSPTAFHKEVWKEHTTNGLPLSILTPYTKGSNFLPKDSDLARLKTVSEKVGVTAKMKHVKPKKFYSREILRHTENVMKNWRIIEPQNELGFLRIRFGLDRTTRETIAIPPAYWY